MNSCSCVWEEATKWEDHVTSYNTRAKRSWLVIIAREGNTTRTDKTHLQLDAGQHPAYDGLAALPYFDEFDLSTVDVLLISQ